MPDVGGYSAGSIFLQVVPSFRGFEAEARRVAKGMEGVIEDGLDQGAEKGSAKAKEHIKDALTDPAIKKSATDAGQKSGDAFGGAFQDTFKKRVNNALKSIGTEGGAQVDEIRRSLESLRDKKIGVDVDAKKALASLAEVQLRANIVGALSPNIDVQVNAKKASAEITALNVELAKMDGKKVNVDVDVDTKKATSELSAFNKLIGRSGSNAEDGANSFRAFNGVLLTTATIGPALIPILVAIAGGMAALGPAAVAAVAGIGILGIAFSGLGNAITALNDVQKNSAKDQEAGAKRVRNAAETVAAAQKRVGRAVTDAAESNADAARRTKRAQADAAQANEDSARRVVDAQQRAAQGVEDALQRQEEAEKSLANAQKDATKAQQDLRTARLEAQKDLDNLADKQKQNSLDERQAVIDLFNATVEFNAIQASSGGSTNLEKEQSSINLEQARLRLVEIRKEEKDLAAEKLKGVDASDKVLNAEESVKSALEQQQAAQQTLLDAVADTNKARIDGAADVATALREQARAEADGIESVSDAIRAQKRTAVDSALAISDAQQALKQSQSDYADALYETNVLGSASAQKLKQAMDALGPSGQAFAVFIFGLKDEFLAIRNVVQAGLFPGLTAAIKTLVDTYLPDFTAFAGEIATTFGEIAKTTATVLTNDTWKQFFSVFRDVSPDLIKNYSLVFLNLATVMAQLATVAAPFAVKFSAGLADLTADAVRFMSSAKGQKMWVDFFAAVERVGPQVVRFFEALVPAFLALVEALLPFGELILGALTGILEWIAAMDPKVLEGIILAIVTLVIAFQAAAAATSLMLAVTAALATPLGVIVAIIVAVIGILVYLYLTNETARKIIDGAMRAIGAVVKWVFETIIIPNIKGAIIVFRALGDAANWLWNEVLKPVFSAIAGASRWLWENFLNPIFTAIGQLVSHVFHDISWLWNNLLWPVFSTIAKIVWELYQLGFKVAFDAISQAFRGLGSAFQWIWDKILHPVFKAIGDALGIDTSGKEIGGGLVGAFRAAMGLIQSLWDGMANAAKAPIKFMIETVFNGGLIGGFNWLADKLGMDKVEPIPVPKFRDGGVHGVRPGYTPGRDTHLIAVGGGEAILRPELTRALGSDWVYAANARAKKGGVRGAMDFLGGFANGGIAGIAGSQYDRTTWRGHQFNNRTVDMLKAAERLFGQSIRITQGSYSNSVAASGSTHSGGGAFDAGWPGLGLGPALVNAFRQVGFAAWGRNPSQGPWPYHIHGIAIGDPTASDSAKRQVQDYLAGGDGLGGSDPDPKSGDQSTLGKLLGGLKNLAGWVKDAVANPLGYLKSKIEGPLGDMKKQFGDNWLTQGMAKIPDKFFGALVDRIKGMIGIGGDEASSIPVSDVQRMVQGIAQSKYGWAGSQWDALNWLVNKESGWNPNAQNPTSSAFGLFQFLDGTWSGYGPKTSDPRLQAEYGLEYIKDRYKNPEAAKAFHEGHNWYSDGGVVPGGVPDNGTMMYDNGGFLPPGLTTVLNLTGSPEPVFTSDQFDNMRSGGSGGFNYSPTFVGTDLTPEDVAGDILFAANRARRGGVYAGGRP